MAKNEVATQEKAEVPAVIDYGNDFGSGFEEADSSSYAIPFLRLLQSLSAQAKKKDPAYIDGAEEGDFFNTVTEKLYKGEVTVIPCHYAHKYNLWAPDRGGFRGSMTPSEYATVSKKTITDSKGVPQEIDIESGNIIQDTREHYLLIVNDDDSVEPALLALSGSQLKKSKKWMTLMQGIRIGMNVAPMFSQKYLLTSVGESNDKGSWVGIAVKHLGQVTSMEQYTAAKQFREMVRSGAAQASPIDSEDLPY